MTVTLQVPSGPGRTILVEALDSDGLSHFRGVTVVDASGVALSVTIDMAIDPSNPALRTWTVVDNTASSTLYRIVEGDGILLAGGAGRRDPLLARRHIMDRPRLPILPRKHRRPGVREQHLPGDGIDPYRYILSGHLHQPFLRRDERQRRGLDPGRDDRYRQRSACGRCLRRWNLRRRRRQQRVLLPGQRGDMVPRDDLRGLLSVRVAYGNGRFVAIDRQATPSPYPPIGIAWTTASMGLTSTETLRGIGFGNGLFLATTSLGECLYVGGRDDVAEANGNSSIFPALGTDIFRRRRRSGRLPDRFLYASYFSFDSGDTWTAIDLGDWLHLRRNILQRRVPPCRV